jgi:predicted DNA-binding protein
MHAGSTGAERERERWMVAEDQRSQADIDTIAMLSVRVHPDLRKRLKRYSVESGKSMQEIVETAITRYIDAEESA